MKWPNLFLYVSDSGGNVTYSKISQHTWKTGELIRNKHWNNLYATPMFKKVEQISQEATSSSGTILYDILYSEAEKILLNGGLLFLVTSEQEEQTTINNIVTLTLYDFLQGNNPFIQMAGSESSRWEENSDGSLLYYYDNTK